MAGIKNKLTDIGDKIKKEYEIVFGDRSRDKIYKSTSILNNEEEAVKAFERSVEKLFNVDRWSKLPGIASDFELYNAEGIRKQSSQPSVGDYLRILIPGPIPENWVSIIDIKKSSTVAEFTVTPDVDPRNNDETEVEHFFIDEATSTFKVERKGNDITGYEIGKNEGINNKGEEAGNRKLINTVVAETAWAAFQRLQWKKLTDYLVHKIEVEK